MSKVEMKLLWKDMVGKRRYINLYVCIFHILTYVSTYACVHALAYLIPVLINPRAWSPNSRNGYVVR
jgi:hypothetical protein